MLKKDIPMKVFQFKKNQFFKYIYKMSFPTSGHV